MNIPVSVLILTLNEEVNLPGCFDSLTWCDDIVVLDSGSYDATQQIAQNRGARFVVRKFDNYASQRNFGLREISYKNSWVLMVDADERWPEEIAVEIDKAISFNNQDVTIYHFRRKDLFMGRWLRRSSGYPTWFGRLVRPNAVWVERDINEEYHTDGRIGHLREHFFHYPFNKGIAFWFERHNRYSSMEAKALVQEVQSAMSWKNLVSKEPTNRRKALKQLAFRMPCRPLLVFIYLYFFRFGFLDGRPGFIYARMRQMYETMIDLKVKELKRRDKGLPV